MCIKRMISKLTFLPSLSIDLLEEWVLGGPAKEVVAQCLSASGGKDGEAL